MIIYIAETVLVTLLGLLVSGNYIVNEKYDAVLGRGCAPFRKRAAIKGSRQSALNITAMWAIFIILFGVSAARIAVGNDYWPYRDNFLLIAADRTVSSESGFNLCVKLMQWIFGPDNYIPIFALFSFITAFFFVKAVYDQSEWVGASIFLIMVNGFYFSSFTSIRYFMALAVALFALKFVENEQYFVFVIYILAAAFLFHKSVLLVIPFYLAARLKWRKWMWPLFFSFVAVLVFLKDFVRRAVFIFYPFYEDSYLDNYSISWINIMKAAAVLIFSLIYYKDAVKGNTRNTILFRLNIMALTVFAGLWYIPETTRIGFYFSATNIFFLPGIIKRIPNKNARNLWTGVIALAYFGYFIIFLKNSYATNVRLLPYYSWIFI